MIVRGVNVFPTQIEELVLREPGLAPHFVCVLTRPERLDELTIRVEARAGAGGPGTGSQETAGAGDRATRGTALARRIKDNIGVSVNVEVVEPGTLERSLGKAKRILDQRPR